MKIYFSGGPHESVHIEEIGGRNNMFSYFYSKLFEEGRRATDSFFRHLDILKKKRRRNESE